MIIIVVHTVRLNFLRCQHPENKDKIARNHLCDMYMYLYIEYKVQNKSQFNNCLWYSFQKNPPTS